MEILHLEVVNLNCFIKSFHFPVSYHKYVAIGVKQLVTYVKVSCTDKPMVFHVKRMVTCRLDQFPAYR